MPVHDRTRVSTGSFHRIECVIFTGLPGFAGSQDEAARRGRDPGGPGLTAGVA